MRRMCIERAESQKLKAEGGKLKAESLGLCITNREGLMMNSITER